MPVSPAFLEQYASALQTYLDQDGEAALKTAYDLGRRAISDGVGLLELAGAHQQAVQDQLPSECVGKSERASRFLIESLAPYEMTHRGFREANAALSQMTDTLEQRVVERTAEAETARDQAESANRAKSDFLAIMSHELRTPLNAVLGYADLLDAGVSGPLTEPQQSQVTAIRNSAKHLLELIEEILAFAKIESGRSEVEFQTVNLPRIVEKAAALVRPAAAARGLDFEVTLRTGDLSIETDGRKLRQILVNLLSNAIKFTEAGRVELEGRLEPDWVILQVKDTGIGIPDEHLEHIFDAFWQVERTTTRTTGGTGLGLSVSRSLARQLGGDLTVQSTPGRGSVFTLTLPLRPTAAPTT